MLKKAKENDEIITSKKSEATWFSRLPGFKNKRLNKIAYPGLACLLVLVFMFQNCKQDNSNIGVLKSETSTTSTTSTSTASTQNPDPSGQTPTSPPQGGIIASLSSDTAKTPKNQFNVGESANLEFVNFNSDSNNFKWTVQRGFANLVDAQATTQPNHTISFASKGNHDIIATSHATAADVQVLTGASARLTVGLECDPADTLEIKLQSGSLVKGQSVTFSLEDSQLFTNISWKVQQPSQTPVEQTNQNQIPVDLDASASTVAVEVTAVKVDTSKSQCLIYRKKEFPVQTTAKPNFDFVRPFDETHSVVLENNDIYKYKRTSSSKYIQVHVSGSNNCSYNNQSIACSGGKEDISQSYLTTTECNEAVEAAQASYFDSNNNTQTESRSFYHFCPKDKDFCYFGPSHLRPNHHHCSGSGNSTSPGRTPSSSSSCLLTQIEQGYKEVNGSCLPSCSIAGGTHTGNDCVENDAYDLVLLVGTHEDPCCKRTAKEAVNGVCNNAIQNGCTSGTPQPQTSSGGYYRWHCKGVNGGTDATDCQKLQTNNSGNAINGVCDNSIINGCNPGNATPQADSNGFHNWHCYGINGGTNALNCQKAMAINGVCNNSVQFSCHTGTPADRNELTEAYTWTCQGINGGITVSNCRKDKPVNGQCDNSTKNTCLAGTPANTGSSDDSETHYKWHCNGKYGGTNATDCQKAIPINAQCGTAAKNTCDQGTLDSNSVTTSGGFYQWRCEGQHEGTNADCQLATGSRCNYPDTIENYINTCKYGATFTDKTDDEDYYKWACTDASGEERCQRFKPFHGECHSTVVGQCNRGVAGTVSTQIEDYALSGHYVLPELPGNQTNKSKELNEDIHYQLSTLDSLWSCEGGLSKIYCRATQAFAGECPSDPPPYNANNDFINYCKTGYVYYKRDNQQEYSWRCYGTGSYNNSSYRQQCQRQKSSAPPATSIKSQGECSKQPNKCRGGIYRSQRNESIKVKYNYRSGNSIQIREKSVTMYKWECEGSVPSNSGPVATKQACKRPSSTFTGECDNTNVDSCAGGVFYNLTDSDTHYRWMCFGQNNNYSGSGSYKIGGHIVYCSKPKFQVIEQDGVQTIRAF